MKAYMLVEKVWFTQLAIYFLCYTFITGLSPWEAASPTTQTGYSLAQAPLLSHRAGHSKYPANHTRKENLVTFRWCTKVTVLKAIFSSTKTVQSLQLVLQLVSVFTHDFHRVAFKYKCNRMIRPLLTVPNNSLVLDLSSIPSSLGLH